jgi:hypothetical protein
MKAPFDKGFKEQRQEQSKNLGSSNCWTAPWMFLPNNCCLFPLSFHLALTLWSAVPLEERASASALPDLVFARLARLLWASHDQIMGGWTAILGADESTLACSCFLLCISMLGGGLASIASS